MNREEIIQDIVECATISNGDTIRIQDLEKLIEVTIKNIALQEKQEDIKGITSRLECYKITHPSKIPIYELESTLSEIICNGDSKKNTIYAHAR